MEGLGARRIVSFHTNILGPSSWSFLAAASPSTSFFCFLAAASPSTSFFFLPVLLDFPPPSCDRASVAIGDAAEVTAAEGGATGVRGKMAEDTLGRANEEPKEGNWPIDDPDDAQKPNGVVLRLK